MTRPRLAHVLNPVAGDEARWLMKTQRVTFEAIRRAMLFTEAVRPELAPELLCAVFDEDRPAVPSFTSREIPLERSLLDLTDAKPRRKLPLIRDVFEGAAEHTDAEYLIYTNLDIGPQPFFYELIDRLLRDHPGGFGLTRRLIDKSPIEPDEIALMYCQVGARSYGVDTFVFPREAVASFELGDLVLGLPLIENAILCNIDQACGYGSTLYKYTHAVFHHGDDAPWKEQDTLSAWSIERVRAAIRALIERDRSFPAGGLFDRWQAHALQVTPKSKHPLRRFLSGLGNKQRIPEPFRIEKER
ncbi:MAG: hypothetical protein AAGG07_12505 [Planctomycetota bacterium]